MDTIAARHTYFLPALDLNWIDTHADVKPSRAVSMSAVAELFLNVEGPVMAD